MLLYWHGGYPVNNLNQKYNTILKLIEKDFLLMSPNDLTPEKEFCATSVETKKLLNEALDNVSVEYWQSRVNETHGKTSV